MHRDDRPKYQHCYLQNVNKCKNLIPTLSCTNKIIIKKNKKTNKQTKYLGWTLSATLVFSRVRSLPDGNIIVLMSQRTDLDRFYPNRQSTKKEDNLTVNVHQKGGHP